MRLALVGATGLVGREMITVLEERGISPTQFIPVASERSAGTTVKFKGVDCEVVTLAKALALRPDVALFSAGGTTSLEWAPRFAEMGCRVIDNSSAWRMDTAKKLVVPEINGDSLGPNDFIIANPNCSTIQMVMVLWPLHKAFGLQRVIVSTYQSVSGTGVKALDQLMAEREGREPNMVYPYRIDLNCIPHCDSFLDNGYTKEEMKLVHESRKIMGIPQLRVSATAVRVPVMGGHSEAVNAEFSTIPDIEKLKAILSASAGVVVQDNPSKSEYPMPFSARGTDHVYVGRIRPDLGNDHAINLWIVADNLRKGAATNAVQILELLVVRGMAN